MKVFYSIMFAVFFALLLVKSGCGSDDHKGDASEPADSSFDSGATDASYPSDTGVDAAFDGGGDAGETDACFKDSGTDAGYDAGYDAGAPDTGDDGGADAGVDSGEDTGMDAGMDAGEDSGFDAGVDSGWDSGFDAGEDSGIDAGFDGGADGGLSIEWIPVPGGSFTMGCSTGDLNCLMEEKPRHLVTLEAFWLMKYEATQGEWKTVMGNSPSHFSSCGEDCPVESIDWNSAREFCARIGGRLPSESEWEYAGRAGTDTKWQCGGSNECLDGTSWYGPNSGDTTHPIGEKTANAWQLYDPFGNVWEWVEDDYHVDYNGAPSDGSAWIDEPRGPSRILRGGSWGYSKSYLRPSQRYALLPTDVTDGLGVRCAK